MEERRSEVLRLAVRAVASICNRYAAGAEILVHKDY